MQQRDRAVIGPVQIVDEERDALIDAVRSNKRILQTGSVQVYALAFVVGVALIFGYYMWR